MNSSWIERKKRDVKREKSLEISINPLSWNIDSQKDWNDYLIEIDIKLTALKATWNK